MTASGVVDISYHMPVSEVVDISFACRLSDIDPSLFDHILDINHNFAEKNKNSYLYLKILLYTKVCQ